MAAPEMFPIVPFLDVFPVCSVFVFHSVWFGVRCQSSTHKFPGDLQFHITSWIFENTGVKDREVD